MVATTHGIPTTYRRAEFRSRLEARWASFFDLIGWKWTYEPLDADGYIPDFLIHGKRPFFVEIGPCILQPDFEAKAQKADEAVAALGHDVLVVGVNPVADIPTTGIGDVQAGWLGEIDPGCPSDCDVPHECRDSPTFAWGSGEWFQCKGYPYGNWPNKTPIACGRIGIYHSVQGFTGRPCGHYDGDHHLGTVDPWELDRLWNHAGSTTQWKPWKR